MENSLKNLFAVSELRNRVLNALHLARLRGDEAPAPVARTGILP